MANKKVLTNIDMSDNQLINMVVEKSATTPLSPVSGQVYYNTTSNLAYFYNGTSWVQLGGNIADPITGTGSIVYSNSPSVTGLNLAAGTATKAPMVLSSGTNLTSPSAGAVEYDANGFYLTSSSLTGRGLVTAPMIIQVISDRAKTTNNTTLEGIFDPANDTINLAGSTRYLFQGTYYLRKNTLSGNGGLQIGFGFGNAPSSIRYDLITYVATAYNNTTLGGTTQQAGSVNVATAIAINGQANTTAENVAVKLNGFIITAASTTFSPQFTQTQTATGTAAQALAGTIFQIQPVVNSPLVSGSWF